MEQIQFIYFQDYKQHYTVHHKENITYMEIWHRGWWFKLRPQLPVWFGFTIIASQGKCSCIFLLLTKNFLQQFKKKTRKTMKQLSPNSITLKMRTQAVSIVTIHKQTDCRNAYKIPIQLS